MNPRTNRFPGDIVDAGHYYGPHRPLLVISIRRRSETDERSDLIVVGKRGVFFVDRVHSWDMKLHARAGERVDTRW